jgi:hypothetical protein
LIPQSSEFSTSEQVVPICGEIRYVLWNGSNLYPAFVFVLQLFSMDFYWERGIARLEYSDAYIDGIIGRDRSQGG